MANIVNLDAESGGGMIGDDSSPTLAISNSSTGRALDAVSTSAAAVRTTAVGAANATARSSLELAGTSVASGAVIALLNLSSFVSTETIDITLVDMTAGALRVVLPNGTFGWIPVLNDDQVTAVAV